MVSEFFSVKEVAELVELEPYVLRFYEKELKLEVPRNAQGHRVYTLKEVSLFKKVKELRDQGLQLKAIENLLHHLEEEEEGGEAKDNLGTLAHLPVQQQGGLKVKGSEGVIDITSPESDKVKEFFALMQNMIGQTMDERYGNIKEHMKDEIKEEIQDELVECVEKSVEKKMCELEKMADQKNEAYYRKIDETIREFQRLRKELADQEGRPAKEEKEVKLKFWQKLFKEKQPKELNIT